MHLLNEANQYGFRQCITQSATGGRNIAVRNTVERSDFMPIDFGVAVNWI